MEGKENLNAQVEKKEKMEMRLSLALAGGAAQARMYVSLSTRVVSFQSQ